MKQPYFTQRYWSAFRVYNDSSTHLFLSFIQTGHLCSASIKPLMTSCSNLVAYFVLFQQSRAIYNLIHYRYVLCLYRQRGRKREGEIEGEIWKRGGRRRGREHATECPKPLEQGIFLVDWAIHSRHVTLNFFHYKTLLPSPLQRQIACTYFTQWNIASPLKQSFLSQSLGKKMLWLVCNDII